MSPSKLKFWKYNLAATYVVDRMGMRINLHGNHPWRYPPGTITPALQMALIELAGERAA